MFGLPKGKKWGNDSYQGHAQSEADDQKRKKSPCASFIVPSRVEEEGDEGVVDDGDQEGGGEEGVQVGCELPHLNIVSIDSKSK